MRVLTQPGSAALTNALSSRLVGDDDRHHVEHGFRNPVGEYTTRHGSHLPVVARHLDDAATKVVLLTSYNVNNGG
jgi:hypothetical protein